MHGTDTFTLQSLSFAGATSRWRTEAMRSHSTARLIHVSKGQGRMTVAGLTTGYGPNNLIYIPAGTMYGMDVGPSVFGQVLTLPDTTGWPAERFHLRLRDVDPQREVIGLLENIERELKPSGDIRAARCYLGLLTIFIERQLGATVEPSENDRSDTAAARLVARYTNLVGREFKTGQNVADYAARLNVTPTHLTRSCRKTCGHSASQLLRDRIHFAACTMLKDTQTPVSRIAADLGFRSAAYFTRSFQEKAGLTPSAFRRMQGQSAVR
ncbi:MAG: AraC family transcriptional regulator [Pseudomonadota bacterium]